MFFTFCSRSLTHNIAFYLKNIKCPLLTKSFSLISALSCLLPLPSTMGCHSELIPSTPMPPDTSSEAPPIGLRHARLQSSPSSCYSEWDSSLWNTWSSITDGNFASARASLISSVDSCYTNASSNFAHFLTTESVSGASLSGKQRHKTHCYVAAKTLRLST